MRTFLSTHWKAIVALAILVVLAVATMSPGQATASLAERLRAHVDAITADGAARPARAEHHIAAALAAAGYQVRRERWRSGERAIEASVARAAPPGVAERTFIIGANGANGSGTAAVLELARLLRELRPSPGTEVRFVFFINQGSAPASAHRGTRGQVEDPENRYPDTGNFIAFAGTADASRQVQQTLSAFRAASDFPSEGLAAPAFVQGVTVSGRAPCRHCAGRTLTISDSAFLGYPYYHTADDGDEELDYDAIARVVKGLSKTIGVLAEGQRG